MHTTSRERAGYWEPRRTKCLKTIAGTCCENDFRNIRSSGTWHKRGLNKRKKDYCSYEYWLFFDVDFYGKEENRTGLVGMPFSLPSFSKESHAWDYYQEHFVNVSEISCLCPHNPVRQEEKLPDYTNGKLMRSVLVGGTVEKEHHRWIKWTVAAVLLGIADAVICVFTVVSIKKECFPSKRGYETIND